MSGLIPAIYRPMDAAEIDARTKSGHDDVWRNDWVAENTYQSDIL